MRRRQQNDGDAYTRARRSAVPPKPGWRLLDVRLASAAHGSYRVTEVWQNPRNGRLHYVERYM